MVVYCCTRKILTKVGEEEITTEISDTKLGDWYVDYLFTQPYHIAIFVSEKTILPIFVPTSPINTVFDRFHNQLSLIMKQINIREIDIKSELLKMDDAKLTKTRNKRILGTMNDQKYHIRFYKIDKLGKSLIKASIKIAEMPVGAINMRKPIDATQELFNS
jgi:hypothetical protein